MRHQFHPPHRRAVPVPLAPAEAIRAGREVLRTEAAAVETVASRLGPDFADAARLVARCTGTLVVTGMGKAGHVGRKLSATFSSTGLPSCFLHPAEAVHGDLGSVRAGDVALALSYSGETEELLRVLPALAQLDVPLVAITGAASNSLGRAAHVTLALGPLEEACPLGLAPSTSTTAMLALGDALALVVSQMRGLTADDFARRHPAGSLGRRLARVDDVMRPLAECRVASEALPLRGVFASLRRPGRRSGAILLVDALGRLSGVFTDSDLARLFEARRDELFDRPIAEVMTARPHAIVLGAPLPEAVAVLERHKISELPVVDESRRPCGMLDITDLLAVAPGLRRVVPLAAAG